MITKVFITAILFAVVASSCSIQQQAATSTAGRGAADGPVATAPDSVIYELIVLETGFDNWFATNRKPLWYHTEEYYRHWDFMYSQEWNNRCIHLAYREPYSYLIEYDYNTDYGVDLNYKLFYFFKFIEYKYGERFFFTSGAL
jgi:hypothetical protein